MHLSIEMGVVLGAVVLLVAVMVVCATRGGGVDQAVDDVVKESFLQAMEWEQIGEKTSAPAEKLVALVRVSTYLNSARLAMKDDDIEAVVKEDVVATSRRIEEAEVAAVRSIDPNAEPFMATRVIR